ncbi:hypothetical protein C8T65DRAFT_828326, partial [Cerioporus squamosus]
MVISAKLSDKIRRVVTGVFYGPGSVKTALPRLLDILGAKKALIVTGKSLFHKTDVVKTASGRALQKFKDVGADVIVSVGGGSPSTRPRPSSTSYSRSTAAVPPADRYPPTLSAAEYNRKSLCAGGFAVDELTTSTSQVGAGYRNDEGHKVALFAPELGPSGVILDAELTLATPERLGSPQAFVRSTCRGTLYRPLAPPPIKPLCYGAIADLFKYLPISKANPQDIEARQKLQIASWMSLWPLKLSGYRRPTRALARAGPKLGAPYSIPHGFTSCLTLAPVVALKAETASKEDKNGSRARC